MLNILIKEFSIEKWFKKSLEKILAFEKIKDENISTVVCGDELIKNLNKKYRKKNKTTDVLSFAEIDSIAEYKNINKKYLGEIFINYSQAKRQSKNIKKEMINLFVHGYLHLRGYLHEEDEQEKKMNERANKLIKSVGIRF